VQVGCFFFVGSNNELVSNALCLNGSNDESRQCAGQTSQLQASCGLTSQKLDNAPASRVFVGVASE
jgi:hypothetical protein